MTRDELVREMYKAVRENSWGSGIEAALDVALAEVLQPVVITRHADAAMKEGGRK